MQKDYKLPHGHAVLAFADPLDTRRVVQIQHRPGVPLLNRETLEAMRADAAELKTTVYQESSAAETIANKYEYADQKVPRKLVHVRVYFDGRPSNILTIPGELMAAICDKIVAIEPDLVSAADVKTAHINTVFSPIPW